MLKKIIAAAFMTTVFTFVTVGTAAITNDQAFAKKKRPVGDKTAAWYLTQCMLNSDSVSEDSKPNGTFHRCCSKSLGSCVVCRNDGTGSCYVTSALKSPKIFFDKSVPGKRPSGTQLAPVKDKPKPRIPPIMGTFQSAPAANAPTADTTKSRPYLNKLNKR